jgi:hypothetical protein
LFTTKPILEIEDEATAEGVEGGAAQDKRRGRSEGAAEVGFTVGPLKGA